MKNIIIYNQKIAAKLMLLGHNLIEVKKNTNNPNFNIYFFKNNTKIKIDMDEILNESK